MDRPTRIITVDWGARFVGALSLIIAAGVALYLYSEFNSTSDDTNLRTIVDKAVTEKLSAADSGIAEQVKAELADELKKNEQRLAEFDAKTVGLMNNIKAKWDQLADDLEAYDKQDRAARDAQFATYLDQLDTRIAASKLVVAEPERVAADDATETEDDKFTAIIGDADEGTTDAAATSTAEVRLRPVVGFVNLLQIENPKNDPIVVDQVSFDPVEVVEIGRVPAAPAGVSRTKIKHLVFDELKHNRATVADEHAEYRMPLKPFVIGPQDEVYLRGEIRSDDYEGYGFSGRVVFSYLGKVVLAAEDATFIFVKR